MDAAGEEITGTNGALDGAGVAAASRLTGVTVGPMGGISAIVDVAAGGIAVVVGVGVSVFVGAAAGGTAVGVAAVPTTTCSTTVGSAIEVPEGGTACAWIGMR